MKNIIFITLIVMCVSVGLFAQVDVFHLPPIGIRSNEVPMLSFEVRSGFHDVDKATVYYREIGNTSYEQRIMERGTETNPVFSVVLDKTPQQGLEYYFVIEDRQMQSYTLPENNPESQPYRTMVVQAPREIENNFVLLSPDPDFSNIKENFVIAFSLFAVSDILDYDSIRLMLNGRDVTNRATITDNLLVYRVDKPKAGKYYYQVSARTLDGRTLRSPQYSSDVRIKPVELPLGLSGRLTTTSWLQSHRGDQIEDESEFNTNANLTFDGQYKRLRFRSRLLLSTLEDKEKQPVNRYSLQMSLPWWDLYLGDHIPEYSSFLLSGKNIRGVTSRFKAKDWSFTATYGNSARSIDGKLELYETSQGDSLHLAKRGVFERQTTAFRVEVGDQRSAVWGLSFAKNKDNINSLSDDHYINPQTDMPAVTPKDNIIIGTDTQFAFFRQRLVLGAEVAMSFFNSNIIGGALSLDSLNAKLNTDVDFPVGPEEIESIFVINENVEPLKPGLNNTAYKAFVRAVFLRNYLNLSYSVVGSSFNSLSANYGSKDARIISLYDNVLLMNNQLAINLGVTILSDNVYNKKEYTTTSTNYFTQIAYLPPGLPSFRVGFTSANSENDAPEPGEDEFGSQFHMTNSNIMFGMGYDVRQIPLAPTQFNISYSILNSRDEIKKSFDDRKNTVTLSANSRFEELPLTTTISYSYTGNTNDRIPIDTDETDPEIETEKYGYNSILLRGTMDFFENKLKPYADFRHSFYSGDISGQTQQMMNVGARYSLTRHTSFSTDLGMRLFQSEDDKSDYSRLNWRFRFEQRF